MSEAIAPSHDRKKGNRRAKPGGEISMVSVVVVYAVEVTGVDEDG